MNLDKLYKMQEELDKHILENNYKRTGKKMSREELLDSTILALLVEVGELANTTRCFKHWSTKEMMAKEIVLDELADVWHFYLSMGNQLKTRVDYQNLEYDNYFINNRSEIDVFLNIYYWANYKIMMPSGRKAPTVESYMELGTAIKLLGHKLGFTDKEVEQAYLKKHEENYKRQEEGY